MTLQSSFATVCVLEIKIPQLKKTICRHVINTNFTESKQWLHLPRKELPKLNNGTDRKVSKTRNFGWIYLLIRKPAFFGLHSLQLMPYCDKKKINK